MSKQKPLIIKICELCKKVFYVKDTKRERKKRFCSTICARSYNGKANLGKKRSEETKNNMSISRMGDKNNFYGKKHTEETLAYLSKINKGTISKRKGMKQPSTTGENNPAKRPEVRLKISQNLQGKMSRFGKDNPNFIDGRSYFPYSYEFNKKTKKYILARDDHTCQNCGEKESLSVHHIDYNKQNSEEDNLITLCIRCNSRANKNREEWFYFYKGILLEKAGFYE